MSELQFVTLLFVAPFLILSAAWLIGLAALEYHERAAIRELKKQLRR